MFAFFLYGFAFCTNTSFFLLFYGYPINCHRNCCSNNTTKKKKKEIKLLKSKYLLNISFFMSFNTSTVNFKKKTKI